MDLFNLIFVKFMANILDVLVKKPKHSNFDLSFKNRLTMAPGTLVPVWSEDMVPGDVFNFNVDAVIKTYPTLSPILGSFKFQVDYFFVPWRLYCAPLRSNSNLFTTELIGVLPRKNPLDLQFPKIYYKKAENFAASDNPKYLFTSDPVPGTLWDYLGFPPSFIPWANSKTTVTTPPGSEFVAWYHLGYWDIFRNYYINTQEDDFYVCTNVGYTAIDRSGLDYIFQKFSNMGSVSTLTSSNVSSIISSAVSEYDNLELLINQIGASNAGLLLRTFLPDQFSAFVNATQYNNMQSLTRVVTAPVGSELSGGTYFTNDQLVYGSKLAKWANRALLSGGRAADFFRTEYAVEGVKDCDIPQYIGSTSTDCIFEDVVSTASTGSSSEDNYEPLGTLAGQGRGYMSGKMRSFRATELGHIMAVASFVPRVDYYQGVRRCLSKMHLSDVFTPSMDAIGMQDIMISELNASQPLATEDQSYPFEVAWAKQPAWTEYMTRVNELHGDLTQSLRHWTLARNARGALNNWDDSDATNWRPTSYIAPTDFGYAFADGAPTAQNFIVQLKFNVLANRPISKQLMPTL